MADNIFRVDPDQLRQVSLSHKEAAQSCVAAQANNPEIVGVAASWGPLFARGVAATVHMVNTRAAALDAHKDWQDATADHLNNSASQFEHMEQRNQEALTIDPAGPAPSIPTTQTTTPTTPAPSPAPPILTEIDHPARHMQP